MKVFIVVTIALVAYFASEAEASKKYVKMLPNGGNVPNMPAIGHSDGTGEEDATNAFGDAFAEADYAWTKELCEADTDGDGQTNGDPCCEWTMGGTPLWTNGVSNPGDASSTSDSSLWANACGASTSDTSESTTETSEPTSESTSEPTSESTSEPTSESTSESTTTPDANSTGSESESTGDSDETGASSSTNTTSSASASTSATAAEKCASDLAPTRALRASN